MNRTPLLVFDKKGADLIQIFTKKGKKRAKKWAVFEHRC